ncbi:MAG: 3-dehydroquinate synthase [Candidatus Omnitrophica bacterium]|nr:3-dehydroquinate synthase [Candidatus Omnitrophota bacterium]MDD5429728.1 3-dehydroquinate synthase [Candidatus Omnitrophota bacterium]
MKQIKVKLKESPYPIFIGENLKKEISGYLKDSKLGNFAVIISSKKIHSLYKGFISTLTGKIPNIVISVADGEAAKSKKWLFKIINEIMAIDTWNKKIFLVCFGGGTIGDLGGFAASIYKRGLPYIQIPTTLLSQIDSSIGGKTAIDLEKAKNVLGSFYQPKAVFIDSTFLKTLPLKEIRQGMAEAIKYGVIADKNLFDFIDANHCRLMKLESNPLKRLIFSCVKIKARIVEKDELENRGIRTVLNYGHTLAHALETASKYKKIPHGSAVSVGMAYAGRLSCYLGKCSEGEAVRVEKVLKSFGLPWNTAFDASKIFKALVYDKKFISGKIRMVILYKIGKVEVLSGISPEVIKKTLALFTKTQH